MSQARCGQYADRYVEYELILIVLDLVLHLRQAYRHLLYNTPMHAIIPALLRLLPLYLVLTVHLHQQRASTPLSSLLLPYAHLVPPAAVGPLRAVLASPLLARASPVEESWKGWATEGAMASAEFVVYSACIAGAWAAVGRGGEGKGGLGSEGTSVAELSAPLSVGVTALLASWPLCLLVALLVWDYPPAFSYAVDLLLLTSHVQAMTALTRCHPALAALMVLSAAAAARLCLSSSDPLIPQPG